MHQNSFAVCTRSGSVSAASRALQASRVDCPRPVSRGTGWRWLVALLLLLAGFSGQTWAHCPDTMNLTVASGGSVLIKCEAVADFWGWGPDTVSPTHGQIIDSNGGDPDITDVRWLKYKNDGSGTTDTFTIRRYIGTGLCFP